MKKTIVLFQLICLVGAIVSEGIFIFEAKNNDQIIVSITLLLIFGAVGTGLLILGEKLSKKPTTW
jgi:hypothetical protein